MAPPSSPGAVRVRSEQQPDRTPDVDDDVRDDAVLPPAGPAQRPGASTSGPSTSGPSTSGRGYVLGGSAAVDVQLQRLESRLLAEAGGDPGVERAVRRYLAESCARFATARVRQFVPILVEREVRERLRAEDDEPAADDQSA